MPTTNAASRRGSDVAKRMLVRVLVAKRVDDSARSPDRAGVPARATIPPPARTTSPPRSFLMERFEIDGPITLEGRVEVSGAKNAALPALAATLLTDAQVELSNLPPVADIRTMTRLLVGLGVEVEPTGDGSARFRTVRASADDAPYELVKTMRASVLALGPLVARRGHAHVSLPGGCAIGPRPVDLHIAGLEAMGAEIEIEHGSIVARAPEGGLRGAVIDFPKVTVTGTENLMMAAALADGETVLRKAAREPEVVDLAELLRAMGASISGDGTSEIRIHGVSSLGGAVHHVIPDRIEAGTWVIAGALAGGRVEVDACRSRDLAALLAVLEGAGVPVAADATCIVVGRPERIVAQDVVTAPHPGFPTDLQAQLMTLMTQAHGVSRLTEEIFENRFQHALELARMGAEIAIEHQTAVVHGPTPLSGAQVMASDLRASAALVLAGLVAEGTTVVNRIYHLRRGYARMDEKLAGLGVKVRVVD